MKRSRRNSHPDTEVPDRLPPHSLDAEQGVLGCVLTDADAAVFECLLDPDAMYDLRHRTILENLLAMHDERIPIDLLTVSNRLRDKGQLEAVGGLAYLASLPDMVPSASHVAWYAKIVSDKARLRKIIKAATEIVGKAYDAGDDIEDVIDEAEQAIIRMGDGGAGTKAIPPMNELIGRAIETIENFHANQGILTGLSTGFPDLDKLTCGLQNGEMIVIAARPSMGKAQPMDSNVLTPFGFRSLAWLCEVDEVIGLDGKPTRVLGIYPQGEKRVFRVTFSDGTSTRCCEEHLWKTQTRNERRRGEGFTVKNTATIAATLHREGGSPNHAVPLHGPVEFTTVMSPLPIHPWLLGALIGDGKLKAGNIGFFKPEEDVQERVKELLPPEDTWSPAIGGLRIRRRKRSNLKSRTAEILEHFNLRVKSPDKRIPAEYMTARIHERLSLLTGLLDTDGHTCGPSVEYSTSSSHLAEQVPYLARGLGYVVSTPSVRIPKFRYKGQLKEGLPSWRFQIHMRPGVPLPITSLKHLSRVKLTNRKFHRSIVSVTDEGMEQCACIRVEAADSLYLTDDFIPTHNTAIAMQIGETVAIDQKLPVGIFSLEMTADSLTMRMLCSRARVNIRSIREGFLAERDFPKLTAASAKIAGAPLYIDDSSSLSIFQLRTQARRMARQYGIKLFVVDYLQLLHSSSKKADNRQQEIADVSRGLKALAKELNVPIIVLSQLNREVERDGKRRPRMADLRESGAIEQDADFVGLLYAPKDKDDDEEVSNPEVGPVNMWIAKQRNGAAQIDVHLTFLRCWTRFESAAKVSADDVPGGLPYKD
jgi:replicative DNA helicase